MQDYNYLTTTIRTGVAGRRPFQGQATPGNISVLY